MSLRITGGLKLSNIKLTSMVTGDLPPGPGPQPSSLMAVAHSGSPYITVYNTSDWSVDSVASLPGFGLGVAFN